MGEVFRARAGPQDRPRAFQTTGFELPDHGLEHAERRGDEPVQLTRTRGRLDPASPAYEQRLADTALEGGKLMAHGRLGQGPLGRGRRQRPAAVDGDERPEPFGLCH